MKKILLIGIVGSFVFAGVSFNKAMVYGGLDATVTVIDAMGVDFDLNDNMSLGYDSAVGLLVKQAVKVGPLEPSLELDGMKLRAHQH